MNYKIGEYVKPLKPIATISGTKSLQSVEIFAPLSEAMSMNIGDKVEIALGAKSESHLPLKTTGEVIGISRRIDPSVASFPVTILIHCPKNREPQCRKLASFGALAKVKRKHNIRTSILIDSASLNRTRNSIFLSQNGVVRKVSVKAGIDWQNMTEIISGVSEGDQVIVAYDTMPSDGDKAILYKKKL